MELSADSVERLNVQAVSEMRLQGLIDELTKRVMVVNPDALQHLMDQGVLAKLAANGCCKPDGGTCCPNRRTLDLPIGTNPAIR